MFNTMTSQFYEWLSSPWKKHALTIGCFTCHMSHANSADFNMWPKQPMVNISSPWKKHAVTIGCLGHMLKSAELACVLELDITESPFLGLILDQHLS